MSEIFLPKIIKIC